MSIIDDAILKYAGADEAYKNKLKVGIRDAMGYSNYVSKLNKELGAPAAMVPMKGNITPAGVLAGQSSAYNIQRGNIGSLERITGGIDTAADSIASSQVAAGKASQGKQGFENGVAFSPQDEIERRILSYMQNPKNPDGSVKSLQQFESELQDYYKENPNMTMVATNADGSLAPRAVMSPEEIKAKLEAKVPKDFIGQEDKYSLMAQGYSEKQAKKYSGALRYDTMSEPEKLIYNVKNPEMAKRIEELGVNKSIINDIGLATDPKTGESTPKFTYDELLEKYPTVPEATIKEMQKPFEQKSLTDDISKFYQEKKTAINKKINNDGYEKFMKDPSYTEFKTKLTMEYGKVFTDREIDILFYNTIRSAQ